MSEKKIPTFSEISELCTFTYKAREKKHESIIPARVINGRRMHIIFYFLISSYPPFGYETCQFFFSYLIDST